MSCEIENGTFVLKVTCLEGIYHLRDESPDGSGLCFRRLFFSILRRGIGVEGMQKTRRDAGYFIDSSQKRGFVSLGRFVKTCDFSHELERGGSNLFIGHGRIEIEESLDITAHGRDLPV